MLITSIAIFFFHAPCGVKQQGHILDTETLQHYSTRYSAPVGHLTQFWACAMCFDKIWPRANIMAS